MKTEDIVVEEKTKESQQNQSIQQNSNNTNKRDVDIQKVLKPEVLDI